MSSSMPLFACTRCRSRHPFEELSEGEQLCKDCRSNYPIVKCTYCRAEFQQEDKNSTNSVCKKCAQNVKLHGKPTACEYCNVIAAFIGNKCQRCTNSEKKWGPPHTCEQCKQQCAFDRREETRKRVDGKLLCWLCTMTYKRVMAKTRQKGGENLQIPLSSNSQLNSKLEKSGKERDSQRSDKQHSNHHSSHHSHHRHHNHDKGRDHYRKDRKDQHHRSKGKEDSQTPEAKKHKNSDTSDKEKNKEGGTDGSSAKKQKLDKSANGLITSKSTESFNDFGNTENMVAITQLREEVESLKRLLNTKDQHILERDKKVTELKAIHFESEKEMRNKLQAMQKSHNDAADNLQTKIRELTRQVSTLSRKEKKTGAAASAFSNSPAS